MPIKERLIELLRNGEVEKFNRYRIQYHRSGKYDIDLRGTNLRKADLRKADLREADLSGANLSGANLKNADLYEADLSVADLSGADLSVANLSSANLRSADLYGADLRSADLYGANLRNADLSSANLSYANLSGANLNYANLSGARLDIHVFQDSGNGSIGRQVVFIPEYEQLKAGCWSGTLAEFKAQVKKTYAIDTKEYESYQDLIEYYEKKSKRYGNKK